MTYDPDFNQILGWGDPNEQRSKGEHYKVIMGILASWYESGAYGASWVNIASHLPDNPPEGRTVTRYNTDESETRQYFYVNSAWEYLGIPDPAGVTDHGGLTGLGDNDHPQYVLVADLINDGVGLGSRMVGHHSDGFGTHTVHDMFNHISPNWILDTGVVSDAGGVSVTWTEGSLLDTQNLEDVATFASGGTTLTDDALNYIYYDVSAASGTLSVSTTEPIAEDVLIARVRCQDGDIWGVGQEENMGQALKDTLHGLSGMFPSFIESGMAITPHSTPLAVDMGSGHLHKDVRREVDVAAIDSTVTNLVRWFHTAGGWDHDTSAYVDTDYWDNGTNKAAISLNKYVKGLFFFAQNKLHYVYPIAEYVSVGLAIAGTTPVLPPALDGVPLLFAVVFQEGDTALPVEGSAQWIDLRITGQNLAGGTSGVSDHGLLTGLSDNDHGAIYYTETEMDAFLALKLNLTGGTLTGNLLLAAGVVINWPNVNLYQGSTTTLKTDDKLVIGTITAGTSDYDKFLTSDGGEVKSRTGAQVLSDIGASATGHTHDTRYYTESEMDAFLVLKSDTTHNHDTRYYTESEIDAFLVLKSDTTHNHDTRYYTESEIDAFISTQNAYLGIGSTNKIWKPGYFLGASTVTHMGAGSDGLVSNDTTDNTNVYWNFDLPLVLNGLNLYISRARLKIYDADPSNYVDRFKITGFVAGTHSLDSFYDDGTNRTTNGIYTYTLTSDEQIGGVFDHFGVRIYTVVGTVGNLDLLNVEVEYYYA